MENNIVQKAKQIIGEILYITIATATKEGKPWNSPVYSAYDENYTFYWVSDQNGQHSKNIAENNKIFMVIYDSTVPEGTGAGVYMEATAYMLVEEEEIRNALRYLDGRVGKQKDPKTRVFEFIGDRPRRVYKAVPEKFWVNSDGDVNGDYIDIRQEVSILD